MATDFVEVRTSQQQKAPCGRCGQPVRWCTDIATGRRVPLAADAVSWSTRFDRGVWESVEKYDGGPTGTPARPSSGGPDDPVG